MIAGREDEIRARAYEIWEREGRPTGRAEDHWEQARREIEQGGRQTTAEEPISDSEEPAPDPVEPAVRPRGRTRKPK